MLLNEIDSDFEMMQRISKDLKAAAKMLSKKAARYLVDTYYIAQNARIRAAAQVRAASEDTEPNAVLSWSLDQYKHWEHDLQSSLNIFTDEYMVGRWMKSIIGIGPVITAGLISHLDITRSTTAGHFLRFCGLDPTLVWEKGQKRPYSAFMKTLTAFKAGESFVKFQNHKNDTYGKLFVERKAKEMTRSVHGQSADDAAMKLAKFKIGEDTEAYAWYAGCLTEASAKTILYDTPPEKRLGLALKLKGEPCLTKTDIDLIREDMGNESVKVRSCGDNRQDIKAIKNQYRVSRLKLALELAKKNGDGVPMLPPAQIHARARRYAITIFLSHLHHVMYVDYFGREPPIPYVFQHGDHLGNAHSHYIPPPNWPFNGGGKSLKELKV
jgi:hypothetical protein